MTWMMFLLILTIIIKKENEKYSYFRTPKDARLNSTHYVIMKIQSRKELQNIAQENSGDISFKDFLKTYKDYISEPYSCMIINTTVPSGNPMRFRKNF